MDLAGMDSGAAASGVATRVVHAVCSLDCPDSCGVLVTVATAADGAERAVKVAGDPAHPVTRGFLCGKVAKYLDRVYAPDRLLYPMRRRAGVAKGPLERGRELEAFERISWDAALEEICGRLGSIAAEFGAESVLPYSYAGTIGQLGYRVDGSAVFSPAGSLAARPHHLRERGRRGAAECVRGEAGDGAAGFRAQRLDRLLGSECARE